MKAPKRVGSETYLAGADLRTKQYHIVKIDSNDRVVLATAGEGDGVLLNAPDVGQAAEVMLLGECPVECGATIARGAAFTSDANGRAKPANSGVVNTSDAGSAADPVIGSVVLGRVREPGSNGARVLATVRPVGVLPSTYS